MEADLASRLVQLGDNVAAAVAHFRATDPDPDDLYRGLYVSDEHVDDMLDSGSRRLPAPSVSANGIRPCGRLDRLMQAFGLDDVDVDLIVASVAPDLDPTYEKLYGYLHDDLTRRRASIGLALQLAGLSPIDHADRARLLAGSALLAHRLIAVEDSERPLLTRSLRVPDRVGQYLLGADEPDEALLDLIVAPVSWPGSEPQELGRALTTGDRFVHIHDPNRVGGIDLGAAALAAVGSMPFVVDLERLDVGQAIEPELLTREARLVAGGLVVGGIDRATPEVVRAITARSAALVLVGTGPWDPEITDRLPLVVPMEVPAVDDRRRAWTDALAGSGSTITPEELDALRLGPRAVDRVARAARIRASIDDVGVGIDEISAGARTINSPGLERLARRIQPEAGWDDLVVKPATAAGLRELTARVRHRSTVFETWGLRRGGGRGEGVTALFTGGSGTGKTLAAEVIGSALGLELYVIDLSTVVDKYIGETEKNLERVFTEAEGVNAILFFDEADALFGKRSEVSDARDRYANLEVSYLLQRMERFDGLAILASNLRGNLDEAFLRRLSTVVDFADPDEALRLRLWQQHLRPVPVGDDVDLGSLAREYELTGGNIRNAAVTAAVRGADQGEPVTMNDLVTAVRHEYRKLGRLVRLDD